MNFGCGREAPTFERSVWKAIKGNEEWTLYRPDAVRYPQLAHVVLAVRNPPSCAFVLWLVGRFPAVRDVEALVQLKQSDVRANGRELYLEIPELFREHPGFHNVEFYMEQPADQWLIRKVCVLGGRGEGGLLALINIPQTAFQVNGKAVRQHLRNFPLIDLCGTLAGLDDISSRPPSANRSFLSDAF